MTEDHLGINLWKRSLIEAVSSGSTNIFFQLTSRISLITHTKSISLTLGIIKLGGQLYLITIKRFLLMYHHMTPIRLCLIYQDIGKTSSSMMKSGWAITTLPWMLDQMTLSKARHLLTLKRDLVCLITVLYFSVHLTRLVCILNVTVNFTTLPLQHWSRSV